MSARFHNNEHPEADASTPYEIVHASLLFLMTQYAPQPDTAVLQGVHDHRQRLARFARQDVAFLPRTCEGLLDQWPGITAQSAGDSPYRSARAALAGSTRH